MLLRMRTCALCEGELRLERVRCRACGMSYEGDMMQSRLARLGAEEQALVERMVLASGNLKEVALGIGVSYPTLKKRIDGLVAALSRLREHDEAEAEAMLGEVEQGALAPEEAARRIAERSGG